MGRELGVRTRWRLVMLHSHLRECVDAPELRKSILHVGQWADRLEEKLTGLDVY